MSEINEELVSAYLDHELSREEREMVEAALARDPKLRQMKDELELIQDDFELLPVYHPQDIQRVIREASSQNTTLPAGPSAVPTESSVSRSKLWLTAGISLAACLLVTVTLLVETGNRPEQIVMTDSAASLPDDMNSQLDQQPRNADESTMGFAAEAEMGGAMGGMGGGFSPKEEEGGEAALPRAAFSQASDDASESADPQVGVAQSQNLNSEGAPEGAPAAPGNAAIRSRIQADQTIRLSVTRNQLASLLETIGSPRPKLAAEESNETANTPQQRKSFNSNLTEPSPNELKQTIQPSPLKVKNQQDKRSAPLPYAVQRTPAELVELMTWLRSSKYWPNRQESEELDYESAKDHYTELLEKSSRKKLKVLFLITIEPDHQLKEQ